MNYMQNSSKQAKCIAASKCNAYQMERKKQRWDIQPHNALLFSHFHTKIITSDMKHETDGMEPKNRWAIFPYKVPHYK